MNQRVLALGFVVLIVGALGWYGNQEGSFLATDYNCGNCSGAPAANTFAIPLDAAYVLLVVGLIVVIAGMAIRSRKLEAT